MIKNRFHSYIKKVYDPDNDFILKKEFIEMQLN